MALTVAEVQKLLDGLEEKLTLRINSFIMGKAVPIKEAIEAHRGEILPQMALPAVKEERMSGTINLFNSTNGEIVTEVQKQQVLLAQQMGAASQALNETQQLDARVKDLTESMNKYAEGQDLT